MSWNRAAERMFGYTAGGDDRPVDPHHHPGRSAERKKTTCSRRIAARRKVDHFETLRQRKDGSLVPISLTVSPIRDEPRLRRRRVEDRARHHASAAVGEERARLLAIAEQNAAITATAESRRRDRRVDARSRSGRPGGHRRRDRAAPAPQFGAFFYNAVDDARRGLHALHDFRRAARGVREFPDAAQHGCVRADVPRRRRRPQRRHHEGSALRTECAVPRHAARPSARAQLSRGAGAAARRAT